MPNVTYGLTSMECATSLLIPSTSLTRHVPSPAAVVRVIIQCFFLLVTVRCAQAPLVMEAMDSGDGDSMPMSTTMKIRLQWRTMHLAALHHELSTISCGNLCSKRSVRAITFFLNWVTTTTAPSTLSVPVLPIILMASSK